MLVLLVFVHLSSFPLFVFWVACLLMAVIFHIFVNLDPLKCCSDVSECNLIFNYNLLKHFGGNEKDVWLCIEPCDRLALMG